MASHHSNSHIRFHICSLFPRKEASEPAQGDTIADNGCHIDGSCRCRKPLAAAPGDNVVEEDEAKGQLASRESPMTQVVTSQAPLVQPTPTRPVNGHISDGWEAVMPDTAQPTSAASDDTDEITGLGEQWDALRDWEALSRDIDEVGAEFRAQLAVPGPLSELVESSEPDEGPAIAGAGFGAVGSRRPDVPGLNRRSKF